MKFWVIIGTKHDISWCDSWSGSPVAAVSGWEQSSVCRRHCPCGEEDEGYSIPEKWEPPVNGEGFQHHQDCREQGICAKPELRMLWGIELVLKSSNHVCAAPAGAACWLIKFIGIFPKKSCWPLAVDCAGQLLEATVFSSWKHLKS